MHPTEFSPLQTARQKFRPLLPHILNDLNNIEIEMGETTTAISDVEELNRLFPHTFGQKIVSFKKGHHEASAKLNRPLRVGVVLSGGQAPGGHNVICGLFDALKQISPESQLLGFLKGPSGIIEKKYKELTAAELQNYRNQGGFDLIGAGRTKIETAEQLQASLQTAKDLNLDGIVVIGGDDSNTNAAVLAEFFKNNGCKTSVIGVPKTIDGDLKNEHIETSFGFDTAVKVYAELISNIARDALSAKKYYHFIKLMGRSASHITLECALQTHANIALIAEEVADNNYTLKHVTDSICDTICQRAEQGKDYGVVLIPEGLIEFIPEIKVLITELNELLATNSPHSAQLAQLPSIKDKEKYIQGHLNSMSAACFQNLPSEIQDQLLLDRDPHGNVQVSKIETEKLIMIAVERELKRRKDAGAYKGKFNAQQHFLGYEGRAAMPTNFDSQYCYALGNVAAILIRSGLTGYMSQVKNLKQPVEEWKAGGIPITMLMNIELRHGHPKPVIQKALVCLSSKAFITYKNQRDLWALEDSYRYTGPIQFFGDRSLTDSTNFTLELR
ncbi:MAG: diphosphate--fructose-6-phosphate 1-phosphotransferase [Chlamydiales bacterium]|jgi:pyrophosphate--fructose-6-phosphate 1-phosphotransferase|nr:diphosphate--fructose-6-phosphate 1-phosphotransferase [Chlamydiales bacterium]